MAVACVVVVMACVEEGRLQPETGSGVSRRVSLVPIMRPTSTPRAMPLLSTLLLLNVALAALPTECRPVDKHAPMEVYLVTTGPGHDMYTRVGHSALWVSGGGGGEAFFNWGTYDIKQDNFLWKFFMGTAKYRLSLKSRQRNDRRVKRQDQMLKAQRLDLPPKARSHLKRLLIENKKPENRTYVYHWETQNCATMIRDMLDESLGGAFQHLKEETSVYTYRHEVLRHLGGLHWTWFGWHFMASNYGDQLYDKWSLLHIPERLMEETGKLQITLANGQTRPLVDRECILNEGGYGWTPTEPPTRWPLMWLIGTLLGLIFMVSVDTGSRGLRIGAGLTMGLFFLFAGGLGSIFMYFYFVSTLDGYGPNENWFYAGPWTLLMVPYAAALTMGQSGWVERMAPIPIFLGAVALLGGVVNVFTVQVNIDFIGLFGVPIVCLAFAARRQRMGAVAAP